MYRVVYKVLKEELLPPAWDDKKKRYCKKRTKMLTLGNGRIECICETCRKKEAADEQ